MGNTCLPFGPSYFTRTCRQIALPPNTSVSRYVSNDTRPRSSAAAGRFPYSSLSKHASSSGARTFSQSARVFTSAPANVFISSGTFFGAGSALSVLAAATACADTAAQIAATAASFICNLFNFSTFQLFNS